MEKKELIRQAAIKVFSEKGYHKATTDRMAEEAGVAVGTIYNYFHNKQDILEYIFEVEFDKRKQFYEEIKKENLHPVEKISRIIEKHFYEVRDNPRLIKIILTERPFTRTCPARRAGLRQFMEEIIADGVKEGYFRDVDDEILAMMLFGIIEYVMDEYLAREGEPGVDIFERTQQELIKLLRYGMAR